MCSTLLMGAAPEDEGLSLRDDPSLRHFYFVHTRKEKRTFTKYFGDCGAESDRAYVHAGEIHPHLLTVCSMRTILVLTR